MNIMDGIVMKILITLIAISVLIVDGFGQDNVVKEVDSLQNKNLSVGISVAYPYLERGKYTMSVPLLRPQLGYSKRRHFLVIGIPLTISHGIGIGASFTYSYSFIKKNKYSFAVSGSLVSTFISFGNSSSLIFGLEYHRNITDRIILKISPSFGFIRLNSILDNFKEVYWKRRVYMQPMGIIEFNYKLK